MKNVFDFDKNMASLDAKPHNLVWRSAKDKVFGIYGSDALHEKGFYRLTEAERDLIRPVNDGEAWFGEHSAGIQVRFETDSAQIFVRVKLRSAFNMTNMTQIGQCGMDLYVYDSRLGDYALHEVARFPFDSSSYEVPLSHFNNAERKTRRYLMYLPLYIAVDEFEIGLDEDASVRPFGFGASTRIGVYGTSITHGCSASRPGMAYTNILSRRLDEEFLNFGFSGTAFMEREMGEILGKRKLDMLIVDTEANAGIDERMKQNSEEFLNTFYSFNPTAPVILFSRNLLSLDLYDSYRAQMHIFYNGFLKDLAIRFRKKGFRTYFSDGSHILKGNFTERMMDGIHPDDVGMVEIADAYEKKIKSVRKGDK